MLNAVVLAELTVRDRERERTRQMERARHLRALRDHVASSPPTMAHCAPAIFSLVRRLWRDRIASMPTCGDALRTAP
jgi:hypothetical protein